jgi:AcrR family transcriptional regulator
MSRSPQRRGAHVPTTRSDATRERILSSAAKTLSVKGYAESRLVDIADTANLRPPAVYYYFDSRDDLIAEVMRVGQERVREHVEEALAQIPSDGSALDKICAAVEAHLRVQLELSDFANAVTRNAGHVPPPVREALQHESDAYHDVWRKLLLEAVATGDLRSDLDPSVARMFVIGALNWATEWWSPERSIDDLIVNARALIRSGLSA